MAVREIKDPSWFERLKDTILKNKTCLTFIQFFFLVFGTTSIGAFLAWTYPIAAYTVVMVFLCALVLYIVIYIRENYEIEEDAEE